MASNAGEHAEKLGYLYFVVRNVKWYTLENNLIKLNMQYYMNHQFYPWEFSSQK